MSRNILHAFAAIAITVTPVPALGFSPHPDCEFREMAVPLPVDCSGVIDRVIFLQNEIKRGQGHLDALAPHIGDAQRRQLQQGYTDIIGILSPIPTSTAPTGWGGPALNAIRKGLGTAVSAATALFNQTVLFGDSMLAIQEYRNWLDFIRTIKQELEDAEAEADECQARAAIVAKQIDDAEAHNRAGQPLLDANDPQCKPPEDGDSQTAGGSDDKEYVVKGDDGSGGSASGGQGGGSGGSSGGDRAGGAPMPDFSRVREFTREEVRAALDWMDTELARCPHVANRVDCAKTAIRYVQPLRNVIQRNGRESESTEKDQWKAAGDRLNDLKQIGNELRRR